MNFKQTFRKELCSCLPYVPDESAADIQEKYNLRHILELGSNENPYGPYKFATQAMVESVQNTNKYPRADFLLLKKLLAQKHHVNPDNIALGSGAGNVLETLAKEFIDTDDEVLITKQSYRLYREISRMMGAIVTEIPLTEDYQQDLEAARYHISTKTKIIWLCNPNNPTGKTIEPQLLENFIKNLPQNIVVIIDEAYADFCDSDVMNDLTSQIDKHPIVIVKTFSKFYGLAGARLGYAIANNEIVKGYDTVTEPFNTSKVALAGAIASLTKDSDEAEQNLAKIQSDRLYLSQGLDQLGFQVINSQTNFVFAKLPDGLGVATDFYGKLLQHGVIVRDGTSWGYPTHLRITVGTHEQVSALLDTISKLVNK